MMDPHKIAVISFLIIGIVTFLSGIMTPVNEEAYEKYKRIKKGVPPAVQKIKLVGVGTMWIIAGILMLLNII